MATLIVETGSGSSTANAYDTTVNVTAYHDDRETSASWAAVSDKEVAIIEATDYLERVYKSRWMGERINRDMTLSWPRYNVVDSDGYAWETNVVPLPIRQATAILALKAGSETTSLFTDISAVNSGVKKKVSKAGPVESEIEYYGGQGTLPVYPEVDGVLSQFILGSSRIFRA